MITGTLRHGCKVALSNDTNLAPNFLILISAPSSPLDFGNPILVQASHPRLIDQIRISEALCPQSIATRPPDIRNILSKSY
jgi:hypothetical protein